MSPSSPVPQAVTFWSKRFGGSGNDWGTAIAVDAAGNVLIAGLFEGIVDFGRGPITSAGEHDIFVAKLAARDGSTVWALRLGGDLSDTVGGITVDGEGNVFMASSESHSIGAARSDGGLVVYKISGVNGAAIWGLAVGVDEALGIALDEAGDILLTGYFTGTVWMGGQYVASAGGSDAFVMKLSRAHGAYLWSRRLGGPGNDVARSLVAIPGGALLIGHFSGAVDFGGGAITSAGASDVFLVERRNPTNP